MSQVADQFYVVGEGRPMPTGKQFTMNARETVFANGAPSVPAMKTIRFLDREGIPFKWLRSGRFSTGAASLDTGPQATHCAVKTQLIRSGDEFLLCVLPETSEIDPDLTARAIGVDAVEAASEEQCARFFGDCAVAYAAPFGNLYDLPTVMDVSLDSYDYLLCSVGATEGRVRLRLRDFERLVGPTVAPIARARP